MFSIHSGADRRSSLRAFVEVVIIATGVAFGLAGDAWWEGMKERERETQYLVNLRRDFEASQQDLERSKAYNDSILRSAEYLLDLMSAERFETPKDSLVDHIALLFMSYPHWPVTTTYDELVASGDLKLILDPELRQALAGWATVVEAHEVVRDLFFNQWENLHTPFIYEETVFTDFDPEYGGFKFPQAPHQMDYGTLLRSRRFWNLVALRIAIVVDLKIHEEDKFAPAVDRVLRHLPDGR